MCRIELQYKIKVDQLEATATVYPWLSRIVTIFSLQKQCIQKHFNNTFSFVVLHHQVFCKVAPTLSAQSCSLPTFRPTFQPVHFWRRSRARSVSGLTLWWRQINEQVANKSTTRISCYNQGSLVGKVARYSRLYDFHSCALCHEVSRRELFAKSNLCRLYLS